MTRILFTDWLEKLNSRMKRNKRNILLFLDNCSAHTKLEVFTNIKIIMMPPNTTSKLQPMDQGVINCFKRFYRAEVVKYLLDCIDANIKPAINMLLALRFARKSWLSVTEATIRNCFRKGHFMNDDKEDEDAAKDPDNWNLLNPGEVTFNDFVNADEFVSVTGELTDSDIIASVIEVPDESDGDSDDDVVEVVPKTTKKETEQAIRIIQNYFHYEIEASEEQLNMIYNIERAVNNALPPASKQSKVDDFFNSL